MNIYIQKLKQELEVGGEESALEMLYTIYCQDYCTDTESIKKDFRALDAVLSKLTLSDVNAVWDITCDLCIEHQRAAFFDGLKIGIQLMHEAGRA